MAQGFRAFTLGYGDGEAFLLPSTSRAATEAAREYPEVEAKCLANLRHRAPQPKCTCGYHAYNEPSGAVEYASYAGYTGIMADVWGYGPVEHHENGFRSRNLQVLNFYHPFCRCKEPATIARASSAEGESWPPRVSFHCENCVPRTSVKPQTGFLADGALMPIAVVLEALATKFKAGVFGADESRGLLDGFRSWNREADEAIRQAAVARQAERNRLLKQMDEEAERKGRKERAKREAESSQQGLGV